ncbi:MAG: SDR family oxidoreductase [Candidatus Entotheonellia bacterium]
MILITGATGRIGNATLKQLTNRGVPARALVHNPEKAAAVSDLGVETVIGDLAQPRSLEAALEGVTSALLVSPLDPHQVELQANFIDAAKRAGRVHVVKISGLGTALDSPVRSGRWHAQTEQYLGGSGLLFTHLRPPFFMQNILRFAPTIRASGEFVGALNRGKVAMIDVDDIAAVAATALTTSGHAGKAYLLTGPEALSYQDVAEKLSRSLGRLVTYKNIPLEAMRERLLASGMPEWHVDVQVDFSAALGAGHASTVTDTVEAVTGKPPRTFEQFIREHMALFTG